MSRRSTPMRTLQSDRPASPSRACRAMRAALCIAAILAVAGCGGTVRSYPGVTRDALWAAAVGTAERPTGYDDWHVVENGVYSDEPSGRIEIYRELKRDYTPSGQSRRRQQETWALSVQLETEDGQIPALRIAQNSTIRHPRFALEADRFFDEVGLRLAQASAQGLTGVPRGTTEPVRGVPDAGASTLSVPDAREAVRGGGQPAAGGPPRQSPEPGAAPTGAAAPAAPSAVPSGSPLSAPKTLPERPQD
jgi:hypothetical protein